jgi:hypothetical protein
MDEYSLIVLGLIVHLEVIQEYSFSMNVNFVSNKTKNPRFLYK